MRFTAKQIALACGGKLHGDDVAINGVSIDTRTHKPGELFVALRSERDGHAFLVEAINKGASALLTDGSRVKRTPTIVVKNTAKALAVIGTLARAKLPDRVVGITGSSGKTTTKNLLGFIALNAGEAAISPRSYNNTIGVPLALANAPDDTFTTVVEMGARFPGDIEELCAIAKPAVGIVTNIGVAHAATFGGIDEIAKSKGALIEALPLNGTAVLNVTDERVYELHHRTEAQVITYGLDAGDIRASRVEFDKQLRPSFRLHTPTGAVNVNMRLHGAHNVMNGLAAAAGAIALNIGMHDIVEGLESTNPPPHRMQLLKGVNGCLLIDDTYNANPESVEAALRALGSMKVHGRRIAVLGPMAELGDISHEQHDAIANLARLLNIEVFGVGTTEFGGTKVESADDVPEALGKLRDSDAVLVKASRVSKLEDVVLLLEDAD